MNNKVLLVAMVLSIAFTSCSSDDDNTPTPEPVQAELVSNLSAPQTGGQGTGMDIGGDFTKFDFETGMETTSETDWDIAFRGTSIAINGGVATGTIDEPARTGDAGATVVTGTFESITTAEGLTFSQDSEAGFALAMNDGWYTYSGPPNHVISPTPGRILVIKTTEGNYAKVEILSYYKDNPSEPDLTSESRYYTFKYVYNPNAGETSFE